ncbi:glycoside hydrolase family 113 [Cognatitamlana onchidii]|uniref:glycoside hydrolase family 113 n=1 Tax=Cognatitamlana onchidii TaxID=2562860 RepID=UPI0010A69E92|nr:glycoside hydrolase TIM-barrel-like domain-containing protein [Algibacter onchidii]
MVKIKLLVLCLSISIQSCKAQTSKINGVSFVASKEAIQAKHVEPVVNLNANFVAIMPFGFIKDLTSPTILFNTERQWFGETKAGAKQYVEKFQKEAIGVMLKPQIWVWRGEFTGLIEMKNENDWVDLEDSYSKFILTYAKLAQEMNVDIFCIGTELEKFTLNRPSYWLNLIQKIKQIYKGKLTYAANWDEYKRTLFLKNLDYIGVDAYFPVSQNETPSVDDCLENWKPYKVELEALSRVYNKSILFTEYGYRSVDFSGKEPWKSDTSMTQVNLEAQNNTTQALFKTFWEEDWFAGGFVWKWFHNHDSVGGITNTMFTPQNKPAEDLIRIQYRSE